MHVRREQGRPSSHETSPITQTMRTAAPTTCGTPYCMLAFTGLTLGHTWDPDRAVQPQGFIHCHRLTPPARHSRVTPRSSVARPSVRSCTRPSYSDRALPRRHQTFVRMLLPSQPGASAQHPFPCPVPNCNGSSNSGHTCSHCIER